MIIRLIFILCILSQMVFGIRVHGQVNAAKKEMSLFNYSAAIASLGKCMTSKDSGVVRTASFLMAECYRKQNDPFSSKIWYTRSWELGNRDPEILYQLAQALRVLGEYDKARSLFIRYDSICPDQKMVRTLAGYCDSAMAWSKAVPDYEISNLTVLNSSQSDFGPAYHDGGILFASDRNTADRNDPTYGWTGSGYLSLFFSECVKDDSVERLFSTPALFDLTKESKWHNGPATSTLFGDTLFMNRTLLSGDKGKKGDGRTKTHLLKLHTYSRVDGKWKGPDPFHLNSDSYSVGHPALTAAGDTLFFASDMPGGMGGTDLYFCVTQYGKWSEPLNLGPEINTVGNEMFPYADKCGNLFFASDGLPGLGGLDLFVAQRFKGSWTRPSRLGLPLNSSFDDFGLASRDGGKSGIFCSNRPGGMGDDDIYSFGTIETSVKPVLTPVILLSGCAREKSTGKPLPGATVFLLEKEKGVVRVLKTDGSGGFSANVDRDRLFIVKALKLNWLPDCDGFTTDSVRITDGRIVIRDLLLDSLDPGSRFILRDIYYDFDKWSVRNDAKPSLDQVVRILQENPVTLELGSFTDCRGSSEYNEILSQKRAEAAVLYIVGKGVDPLRITAKGYGEDQLLNGCNCDPGNSCSEEEHQVNRRTEFRVTGFLDDNHKTQFDPGIYQRGQTLNEKQLPSGFFDKCNLH